MAVKDKPSTGNAQPPRFKKLLLEVARKIETADELLAPRKLKVPLPK